MYQPKQDGTLHQYASFYFLSFNFHFISTKKSIILTLINAGLFPNFDVVEKHMKSQYSVSVGGPIYSPTAL